MICDMVGLRIVSSSLLGFYRYRGIERHKLVVLSWSLPYNPSATAMIQVQIPG
jgi:hypothetical protein